MKKILLLLIALTMTSVGYAGTYNAQILKLQSEGLNDSYNVVYPDTNITDSPCRRTNEENRLQIENDIQHRAALAALLAGKKVHIMGAGRCNSANIEIVNFIMIYRDQ